MEAGFDLRLYGPGWDKPLRNNPVLGGLVPVRYLDTDSYNVVLSSAKISLCFLSSLNRDTYTQRCFEIPASGGFLLMQYSDDLTSLFVEGLEAEFFRSKEELLVKMRRYLADNELRRSIAARGRQRVHRDGHDVISRMKQAIDIISNH
jgi:spore maturation protein CgeB